MPSITQSAVEIAAGAARDPGDRTLEAGCRRRELALIEQLTGRTGQDRQGVGSGVRVHADDEWYGCARRWTLVVDVPSVADLMVGTDCSARCARFVADVGSLRSLRLRTAARDPGWMPRSRMAR